MNLLLNSHIANAVAEQLQERGLNAVALSVWQSGDYRTAPDNVVLAGALLEGRVLVTYDCRTIPLLLKELAETGQHHAGVILVDEQTIRAGDISGLVRAIEGVASKFGNDDWRDRVIFLGIGLAR